MLVKKDVCDSVNEEDVGEVPNPIVLGFTLIIPVCICVYACSHPECVCLTTEE